MAEHEILLYGDGSHLFRAIGWALDYRGYRVRMASSSEAAIEALVNKNFDLVIARLTTEKADGLDVLKRARKLNPQVKVMVVSANHEVTFPQEAYQLALNDYVLMPVTPAELWRRVSQCLERVGRQRAKPAAITPATAINTRVLTRLRIVFHEVRGSMVDIAGALKLLLGGAPAETDPKLVGKLQEAHKRVEKIISLTGEFMRQALSVPSEEETEGEDLELRSEDYRAGRPRTLRNHHRSPENPPPSPPPPCRANCPQEVEILPGEFLQKSL
jgi:CheY-like chemotaxis protein